MGLDLHGQFASGQQNQRGCRTGFGLGQLFQNRNDEAECLAGSGLRSSEHVFALERGRNCAGLHRGGDSEIEGIDALLECIGDVESLKIESLSPYCGPRSAKLGALSLISAAASSARENPENVRSGVPKRNEPVERGINLKRLSGRNQLNPALPYAASVRERLNASACRSAARSNC